MTTTTNAPTTGQSKAPANGCAYTAVGLLATSGLLLFAALTGWPALQWFRAQFWNETPCTIMVSKIASGETNDARLYRPNVRYAYEYDGIPYEGDRVAFVPFGSADRGDILEIVHRYPEGRSLSCYVNPGNPEEAILNREFRAMYWGGLWIVVPVVSIVAFVVIVRLIRRRGRSLSGSGKKVTMSYDDPIPPAAALESTEGGPLKRLGIILIFALFWNGFIALFITLMINDGPSGAMGWFMLLFMTPFVLVGLFLVGLVVHGLLALFNPRPRLVLSPGAIRLGETGELTWEFNGATNRIRRLAIRLEAHESARYTRGTNTVTDTSVFERFELFDSTDPNEIHSGRAPIAIPEFTMHSFDAPDNKFIWQVIVEGDIARWPDIDEKYTVDVRPLAL